MDTNKTRSKMHKLLTSYTPEWNFTEEDPGAVLAVLLSDMLENSRKHLDLSIHKYRIQYLNMFNHMVKEPVSAARGYVQFTPVIGAEGIKPVPRGTELSADGEGSEILFETLHDLCLADSGITSVITTDGREDKIVFQAGKDSDQRLEKVSFQAFDCTGENEASHILYLGFDFAFDELQELNLQMQIQADTREESDYAIQVLSSSEVRIAIAEPAPWEKTGYIGQTFDSVVAEGSSLLLKKAAYTPQKVEIEGNSGYYLMIEVNGKIPDIVMSGIELRLEDSEVPPDKIRLEGTDTRDECFAPFGSPMQLLSECGMDCAQVLSKKDALITISFDMDYELKEEKLDMPISDVEYKTIMKRPPEASYKQVLPVQADRVVWEYLSVSGWKKLPETVDKEGMMNGDQNGSMQIQFICPSDIVMGESDTPRIRIRLLQANNIYKIPALYQCPVMKQVRFSYSYEGRGLKPDVAFSMNNYQYRDCLPKWKNRQNISVFYPTQRPERSMYFCFDQPIQGIPFSLYFDIENLSDMPLDFTVEYARENDFKPIRVVDGTSGMTSAGLIQFLISSDIAKRKMFGKEGYFLRFTGYESNYPKYRLPVIRGIYPNVAKVENRSTNEEYFYIENANEAREIKLNHENLQQLNVYVHEAIGENTEWVEWRAARESYEAGKVYYADMAEGIVRFDAYAFTDLSLSKDGPEIKICYRNYRGELANVAQDTIITLRDSNRYVSSVTNPFPAYGGYDAYTEESVAGYITGMLRSRNRAVTEADIFDLLQQTSYSVVRIKCKMDIDALGRPAPNRLSVAVLTKDYENTNIFSELKEKMRRHLEEYGSFAVMGKEVHLTQPHFLKLNVRLWLEKETMENAYDIQNMVEDTLKEFIDPLNGGPDGSGWEIGSFPRISQITAFLRKRLKDVFLARMSVTTIVEDREVEIKEDISTVSDSPFILPINGEHVVHIDLKQ